MMSQLHRPTLFFDPLDISEEEHTKINFDVLKKNELRWNIL